MQKYPVSALSGSALVVVVAPVYLVAVVPWRAVGASHRAVRHRPQIAGGALLGLYLFGQTLNLYSQIGLIMLVGLAAKNGILIVEFANQLCDQGRHFREALLEAAEVRLRPIVMTGITTAAGSIPLLMSAGAGAETRSVIGIVILSGVLAATVFTLFVVPVAYNLLAKHTGSPGDVRRRLRSEMETDAVKVPSAMGTDTQAMK